MTHLKLVPVEPTEASAALERAQQFINDLGANLHNRRVGDWYPEGANNAALAMSEDMRLLGNSCGDFNVYDGLSASPEAPKSTAGDFDPESLLGPEQYGDACEYSGYAKVVQWDAAIDAIRTAHEMGRKSAPPPTPDGWQDRRALEAALDLFQFAVAGRAMKAADATRCIEIVRAALGFPSSSSPFSGDGQKLREALPQDVVDLVIAARIVAFEDRSPEAIKALDKASEAFASRVPWDNEPEDAGDPL